MLDRCPVRAPNHRKKGCLSRDTSGDFRLEVTTELRLRDDMYAIQQTTEWRQRYRIRAGIEATNSELKRSHGIGKLRVRRLAKVCFAVACKVIACNIKRWARAHGALMRLLQYHVSVTSGYVRLSGVMVISLFRKTSSSLSQWWFTDPAM
jgi:hypothetical protein